MASPSLYILDGSSLLYRSYYGVRPLQTSTGIPTQAIFGFCRTLKKIIDERNPSHLIVVWDSKGPTFRHVEFPEYKANRQAAPSDLIAQKEAILHFIEAARIASTAKQGHEADDLIYSLIQEHKNIPITIVTGDKDLQQLLNGNVSVLDPFKNRTITSEAFVQERGFQPSELLLYHALLGDSSDNIPGVKGIGAKTAQTIAQTYHTIEELYANIEQVAPPRIKELLIEQKADAFLSASLFTLRYHPTAISLDDVRCDKSQWSKAAAFFTQYEMRPVLPNGVNLRDHEASEAIASTFTTHLITSEQELDKLVKKLQTEPLIAFDTETHSLQPFKDGMVGISCAFNESEGYYIPFEHTSAEAQLSPAIVLEKLKPVLESEKVKKVFHNTKFDEAALAHYGIALDGVVDDTLLLANLVRVGSESIGLKALSLSYLKEAMSEYSDLVKGKKSFADLDVNIAAPYAANDARQTWRLQHILSKKIAHAPELESLYRCVELPLARLLSKMERFGINLDSNLLNQLAVRASSEITLITDKITACLAGGQQSIIKPDINLNSPQQLEILLFDTLKLPALKKNSKTGSRSTDSEVLAELSKIHPIPGLIMQYRELSKLLNTYLIPLPEQVNPHTGRIHTTYTQTIAATGRLSSTDPNLQNIPISSPLGSEVRNAFVAPEGYIFISADYSQIELRILAQFSKDPALLDAFAHKKDVHAQTAALIFDVSPEAVTSAQRAVGKKINFSIMYGLTPFGLSKDLGITLPQAKTYIESYFARYAGVKNWMEQTIAAAKETGYVTTLLGRRRAVPGLHERNRTIQEAERRVAINTPIQGTSADIIKMAMLKLDQEIQAQGLDAHLVLQIHDELVIATKPSLAVKVTELIERCMTNAVKGWSVPLEVSVRQGNTWGKVSKL